MLRRVLSLLLLAAALPALATCPANNVLSTPTADFTDNADGTVTHGKTGLTWQRCALGQTWSGSDCTGSATSNTWTEALQAAAGNSFAGYSDWRLPNLKELQSIVEMGCYSPSINSTLFPNDPADRMWSSTSYSSFAGKAWRVDFGHGFVDFFAKNNVGYSAGNPYTSPAYVRLVRGGQLLGPFDKQANYAPSAYSFTNQSNVAAAATITSAGVTLAGLTTPTGIQVSNGSYAVNGGSYTTAPGLVKNGDVITLRHTASASSSTTVTTNVTIGGVAGSFASTTADTLAPALSAVGASGTTTTATTFSATSDEAATGYWVVLAAAAAAPNVTQVKAGQDAGNAAAPSSGNAAMLAATAKTFNITGLTAGTAYQLYFVARDSAGNDTTVQIVSFSTTITAPDAPTGVSANPGNGQATLTFATPSNNGAMLSGYTVAVTPSGGSAVTLTLADVTANTAATASGWTATITSVSGGNTVVTVTGLTNGTSYAFTVAATNNVGTGTASASQSATPALVAPAQPGVSAVGGNAQATLTFAPPADNGAALSGYVVVVTPSGGSAVTLTLSNVTATTTVTASGLTATITSVSGGNSVIVVTGLSNGTSYAFTVAATNSVGTGTASTSRNATPTAPPAPSYDPGPVYTPPPAPAKTDVPSGGTATVTGSTAVTAGSGSTVVIPNGSASTGASITLPTPTSGSATPPAPVTVTINGQSLTLTPTAPGSTLSVKTVTVNGVSTQVLSVTSGSVSVTAATAGQTLLAVGGGAGSNSVVVTAASAGTSATTSVDAGTGQTLIAVSSGVVTLPTDAFAAYNGFAAIKDGRVYAGEVAMLNSAGKITGVRLGSPSGTTGNVGDPIAAPTATGLTFTATIPSLKGRVARVSDSQEFGDALAAVMGLTAQGQNGNGVFVLTATGDGTKVNALPTGTISVDTNRADGVTVTGNGRAEVVKNGVIVAFAPSVGDIAAFTRQLTALDKNASVTVDGHGALRVIVNGVTYGVQPGWIVAKGNGAAGISQDAQGRLVFQNSSGEQQTVYPAFIDLAQLLAVFQGIDPAATAVGNDDGTLTAKLQGKTYTLAPDYALVPAPDAHAKDAWWIDGGKVYVKNGDGKTAQGFMVK